MNLTYTDGCTCTSFDINGTEFIDLPIEQQRELAIKLINFTNNSNVFTDIYTYSLEDSDAIYDMTFEEVNEFYNNIDTQTEEFKISLAPHKQKKTIIDYITNYNINDANAGWLYQHIFQRVLETSGTYEFLGTCDCCGDSIRKYSLTIPD